MGASAWVLVGGGGGGGGEVVLLMLVVAVIVVNGRLRGRSWSDLIYSVSLFKFIKPAAYDSNNMVDSLISVRAAADPNTILARYSLLISQRNQR